jgi:hypothetical protein
LNASRTVAILGILFAGAYYYLAVIDIDYFSTRLPTLGPGPDGQEYFAGAISILRDGVIAIRIGEDLLPSRYPPGFSLAIAPFAYFLEGDEIVLAPYMANRFFGLLMLLSMFGFFVNLGRYYAAGISVTLLATLPAFVTYSRSSMSENLGALLILWTIFLICAAVRKNSIRLMSLAGLLMGLAVSTRLALLLFAPLLLAVFLIDRYAGPRQHFRTGSLVGMCFLIGMSPFLVQNWINFENPLTTGYDFWLSANTTSFSIQALYKQLGNLWREFSLQRVSFDVANIFGTGTYFTPILIPVSLAAGVFTLMKPTPEKLVITASVLMATVIMAFYKYISIRMFYPQLILVIVLMANFYQVMLDSVMVESGRARLRGAAVIFCVVASIGLMLAGIPSRSGTKGGELRVQFTDLLDKRYLGKRDKRYEPIRRISRFLKDREAMVIVQTRDVNVVLASSLLPREVTVIPEDSEHRFRHSDRWYLGENEIEAFVIKANRSGVPIYYAGSNNEEAGVLGRLEQLVPDARWLTLEDDKLAYLACLNTGQNDCDSRSANTE